MSDTQKVRTQIVNEARAWVGTPYHHQGRVKGAGVDCAQLLVAVYSSCGLIPATFDVTDYPMDWHLHKDEERYLNHVIAHAHPVDEPLPGDVVLFQFGRTISHGAIVSEWPFIIHAYRADGYCCVSDVSKSDELTNRMAGIYRLNQLAKGEE